MKRARARISFTRCCANIRAGRSISPWKRGNKKIHIAVQESEREKDRERGRFNYSDPTEVVKQIPEGNFNLENNLSLYTLWRRKDIRARREIFLHRDDDDDNGILTTCHYACDHAAVLLKICFIRELFCKKKIIKHVSPSTNVENVIANSDSRNEYSI